MRTLIFLLFLAQSLFSKTPVDYDELLRGYAAEYEAIYRLIPDCCNPTYEDFWLLQDYIVNGKRKYLSWLNHLYPSDLDDRFRMDKRARNVWMIDPDKEGSEVLDFEFETVVINSDPSNKERCIISYASYNKNFIKNIRNMPGNFKKFDFQGHFLYRIGGWPNIAGGSLKLAHVPYAFKVSMFKEAERLGYKQVLWLDTSFRACKNFDVIFDALDVDGYFILTLPYNLTELGSNMVLHSLDITEEEAKRTNYVAGGIIGINFEHENGRNLLNSWYEAAENLGPFLSPRSDQVALGALAYKLGLSHSGKLLDFCSIDEKTIKPNHYFLIWY